MLAFLLVRWRLRRSLPRPKLRVVPRRARARRAVVAAAALFVALNFGLSAVVERSRPHWRDPEYFHRQKKLVQLDSRNRAAAEPRPLVVVLGSSRPQMGFSPEHAALGYGDDPPLLFNASQSGCQPLGLLMNFRRMLDANVVPDLLLVEVLPAALAERGSLDDQIPHTRIGLADFGRIEPYFDRPGDVRSRVLGAKLNPFHELRIELLANARMAEWSTHRVRRDHLWATMKPNGWSPYYPADWTEAKSTALLARSAGDFVGKFRNFEIDARVAGAQRELLRECRDRGIPAALFLMPESPAFRALHSPASLELLRRHLGELGSEFGVPAFDARSWIEDESAFWDGHHLVGPGAERFSRRFGDECLRKLIGKR